MPEVLRAAELTAIKIELPTPQLAAVHAVVEALDAPADRAGLGHVICIAHACCRQAIARMAVIAPEIAELERALHAASAAIDKMPAAYRAALMKSRTTKFPLWNAFANLELSSPVALLVLAGAELLSAIALHRQFRPDIAYQISELLRGAVEHIEETLRSKEVLARKLLSDLAEWDSGPKANTKHRQLVSRIRASLVEQLEAPNLEDRRGCGSVRELSPGELVEAATALRHMVESGDGTALAIVVAYCCGPNWEIVLDFPFANHAGDDWVARIDARAGVIQIDLTTILELAPPKPGHIPASPVLVIYLPEFAAERLTRLVASDPMACCLRELICLDGITSRSVVPGLPADGPIRGTVARFIRSRATVMIKAGVDRSVAAYACCDLSKVARSSLSYTTFDVADIWDANARGYAALGWGVPVAAEWRAREMGIGSALTPTTETVMRIDKVFVDAADSLRAHKRYTWASVLRHHNAYARLCAHRTALFTAARAGAPFEFHADLVDESCACCSLIDKRSGPFDGGTPLPMPEHLASQLRYWTAHLEALMSRVKKLKPHGWQRIVRRIEAVLERRHVRLFFILEEGGGFADIGSAELLQQHPEIDVKGDWRRHFMINAVRNADVPFSFGLAQLRHHADALSLSDVCSEVPMLLVMEQLAHALDRIALELNMHPVIGLSRGRARHGHAS